MLTRHADCCRLWGSIPDSLGKLSALEKLHLQGNKLTGDIPGWSSVQCYETAMHPAFLPHFVVLLTHSTFAARILQGLVRPCLLMTGLRAVCSMCDAESEYGAPSVVWLARSPPRAAAAEQRKPASALREPPCSLRECCYLSMC
eukprot:2079454-Rhodomonas_salina.1